MSQQSPKEISVEVLFIPLLPALNSKDMIFRQIPSIVLHLNQNKSMFFFLLFFSHTATMFMLTEIARYLLVNTLGCMIQHCDKEISGSQNSFRETDSVQNLTYVGEIENYSVSDLAERLFSPPA